MHAAKGVHFDMQVLVSLPYMTTLIILKILALLWVVTLRPMQLLTIMGAQTFPSLQSYKPDRINLHDTACVIMAHILKYLCSDGSGS